jgi:hypothetical protein
VALAAYAIPIALLSLPRGRPPTRSAGECCGYALGPVLGGVLLELADADLAYLLTAVTLAAAAGPLLVLTRRSQPRPISS